MRSKLILIALFCFFMGGDASAAADPNLFPRPAEIDRDVQFWIRVFTDADTKHGYIHDDRNLAVIYEKIKLPQGVSGRIKQRYIEKVKKRYIKILKRLASGKRSGLSSKERRVLALWPNDVTNKTLRKATKRLRFQLGQSNKYLAGLKRSGQWRKHIINNLVAMGLPTEIASLPHVESSFNPRAYSRVGAAGLWQFTRSTGRRFMRVDHVVDERMDPFKASIAAAQLLENNYAITGSWPLALTAYNHGAAGMRRAARKMGTTDITTILRRYKSRTFKFASRNFYVAFLAAVDVEHNAEQHFGKVSLYPEIKDDVVVMPAYMSAKTVYKALGVSKAELKQKNPALRPAVWNGNKYIPRGYELRIGANRVKNGSAKNIIARIASKNQYAKQKLDRFHRVRRGQTLSVIAARYGVSVRQIVALNSLRSRNRIRVGQLIRLPQRGRKARPTTLAAKSAQKKVHNQISRTERYKVRRGDSVARIAKKFKMTEKQLLALNKIKRKNRIYPGQTLRVKATTLASRAVTSRKKNSSSSKSKTELYKVKRGDSVARIAKKFKMTEKQLLALNNIERRNRIFPGQKLRIKKIKPSGIELAKILTADAKPNQKPIKAATLTLQPTSSEVTHKNVRRAVQPAQITTDKLIVVEHQAGAGSDSKSKSPTNELTSQTTLNEANSDLDSPSRSIQTVLSPAQSSMLVTPAENVEPTKHLIDRSMARNGTDADAEIVHKISKLTPLEQKLPVTGIEDESVSSLIIAGPQPDLSADPSDYSVAKNDTVEVQAAETLGHYAEWLNIRASRLRRINRISYKKPVVIGKRIKLSFSKVSKEEFEKRRREHHRALQEAFFERYQIVGSTGHTLRRGDSLWKLAKRKYRIPIWLVRQYNPDLNFSNVQRGTKVTFPNLKLRLKPVAEEEFIAPSAPLAKSAAAE